MNGDRGERGAIELILLGAVAVFVVMVCVFIFLSALISGSAAQQALGTGPAGVASHTEPTDLPPSNQPVPPEADFDTGGAGLVCVSLPGISYPKTPALDRRVARRFNAVVGHLHRVNIQLTFTYGFRTTCQQQNVNPGGNLKAKPGTSPHEAGRAVDVNGMSVRADRGQVVAIFREHHWRWLGRADPPHFEVPAEAVGEASRHAMIRKNQAFFNAGGPAGCRGSSGC